GMDTAMDTNMPDTGVDMNLPDMGDTADSSDIGADMVVSGMLTITEIDPNMAQTGTNPLVRIRGTGFVQGTTMRLDATALENVEVVSPTVITANVPASLMAGTYDLIAQNPNGSIFTFPSAFTVTDEAVDGGGGDDGCGCSSVRDTQSAPLGALLLMVALGLVFTIRRRCAD